jgi:hypothetical protein
MSRFKELEGKKSASSGELLQMNWVILMWEDDLAPKKKRKKKGESTGKSF